MVNSPLSPLKKPTDVQEQDQRSDAEVCVRRSEGARCNFTQALQARINDANEARNAILSAELELQSTVVTLREQGLTIRNLIDGFVVLNDNNEPIIRLENDGSGNVKVYSWNYQNQKFDPTYAFSGGIMGVQGFIARTVVPHLQAIARRHGQTSIRLVA